MPRGTPAEIAARRAEVKRLAEAGLNGMEITARLDASRATIYRDLEALGFRREREEAREARRQEIARLRAQGMQQWAIADAVGVTQAMVSVELKALRARANGAGHANGSLSLLALRAAQVFGPDHLALHLPQAPCKPCEKCSHLTVCRRRDAALLWMVCEAPEEGDLLALAHLVEAEADRITIE